MPYIKGQLQCSNWVDIVFDRYFENNLKFQARSKHGKGVRRRVETLANLPGNWQQFLWIDANKTELFSLLAECITCLDLSIWHNHVDNKPGLPYAILFQVVICSLTHLLWRCFAYFSLSEGGWLLSVAKIMWCCTSSCDIVIANYFHSSITVCRV